MRFGRDPHFRGDRLAPGAREPGTGRKRDLIFADTFMEELHRQKDVRSAILAAGKRLDWHWAGDSIYGKGPWRRDMTDRQILKKGRKILERESVVEYMKYTFEAVGFTPVDGARMLVKHINGELTKEVALKDGSTTFVAIPPSLDALKHYHSLTLEEQTKKVQIDSRTLVAHKMISEEPPKMRARVLKNVTAELPSA